jgi:hypothetical protein
VPLNILFVKQLKEKSQILTINLYLSIKNNGHIAIIFYFYFFYFYMLLLLLLLLIIIEIYKLYKYTGNTLNYTLY